MKHFLLFLFLLPVLATAQTGNASRDTLATGVISGNSKVSDLGDGNLYVTKRVGTTKTVATLPVTMARWQIRGLTQAPKQIRWGDAVQGGLFNYSPTSSTSTTPDDGVLVLADIAGHVYVRDTPGNKITPEMFGANARDNIDDTPALTAWLSVSGTYEHTPSAGTYLYNATLTRTNKGALSLTGPGTGKCLFKGTADVNGFNISNPAGGNLGLIFIQGITIVSSVSLSAGRTALYIASQHEQQPGVKIAGVSVQNTFGFEFPVGLNMHDCSSTTVDDFTYNGVGNGAGVFTTTGLLIDNTSFSVAQGDGSTGRPSVNHDLTNIKMQAVGTGVRVSGVGQPAIEGVRLDRSTFVSCNYGFLVTNTGYAATLVDVSKFHSEGYGPGIDISGFTQIETSHVEVYTNNPPSGVGAAVYSVRFNNPLVVLGSLKINAQAHTVTGVDITGSGSSIVLNAIVAPAWGDTHGARITSTVPLNDLHINRLWTGANGTNTGQKVYDYNSGAANVSGFPQEDSEVSVYVTPDNSGVLNLINVRAPYVTIPASYTLGVINTIQGQINALKTIQTEVPLVIKHTGSGGTYLDGGMDAVLPARSHITLRKTTQQWEEVSRNTFSGTVLYNVGLADFGAVGSATNTANYYTLDPRFGNDGEVTGKYGYWNSSTSNVTSPANAVNYQLDLGRPQPIDKVICYFRQDGAGSGYIVPNDGTTATSGNVLDFQIQYYNNSSTWVTLATVTGNNLVKRTVTFPETTSQYFRILITNTNDGQARVVEMEVYSPQSPYTVSTTKKGSVSLTGSSATQYQLVYHGLGVTPSWYSAIPQTAGAGAIHWITADANYIYANFSTAPGSVPVNYTYEYKK